MDEPGSLTEIDHVPPATTVVIGTVTEVSSSSTERLGRRSNEPLGGFIRAPPRVREIPVGFALRVAREELEVEEEKEKEKEKEEKEEEEEPMFMDRLGQGEEDDDDVFAMMA